MTPVPDFIGLLGHSCCSLFILPQGMQLWKKEGKKAPSETTCHNPPPSLSHSHSLSHIHTHTHTPPPSLYPLVPVKPPSAMLNMNRCFMAFLCLSSADSLSVSPFCSVTTSFFSSSFFSSGNKKQPPKRNKLARGGSDLQHLCNYVHTSTQPVHLSRPG